jgi:hypothetical protein
MARLAYEGNTKVYWATTVASKTAPTVANITAATNLTPFIVKDGVTTPATQNMVDSATIDEVFDAQVVGSWGGGALELTMFRDNTSDTAYNLVIYGTNGFVIIWRFAGGASTPSSGAKVEVWPAQMHEPAPMASAANEMQKFKASFAITSAPAMRATVAP